MAIFDNFNFRLTRRRVGPTQTAGVRGVRIIGGYVDDDEKSKELRDDERYKTFSNLLANVSIVAAGTRYFLNLVAKAQWKFEPSEEDADGEFAERTEKALTEDPLTPWHRIVRRSAMYRFYGFSVQEWTARRGDDGALTFRDVSPRPQLTIERWEIDDEGYVTGVEQVHPNTGERIYLPRPKLVYMVDDTLSDSPEGLGLFRHLVAPGKRLKRYEQLEGWGFETDLRGIPIARGPFTELARLEEAGEISKEDREKIELPMREFIKKHIKTPELGLLLDSITYRSEDERATPSQVRQWDIDLLKGSNTTQEQVAAAISRVNHEIARILGVEGLLLGGEKVGSLALSRDKSHNLFLIVDGSLLEIGEQYDQDLVDALFRLNGWPMEMKPAMKHESVQFKDVEQITASLRNMAQAGAMLSPDDPAIAEVRSLLGLSPPDPVELLTLEEDASLLPTRQPENEPDDGDLPDPQEMEDNA